MGQFDGKVAVVTGGTQGLGAAITALFVERGARGVVIYAGLLGSRVGGRGLCRGAAFGLSGLLRLANFFITISHCAWQRVISLSKATKKRSKESAFKPRYPKCPQRAVSIHRCPKSTVLARATDV
ncbi:hypothetical protein SBC1_47780 (plasmid) [Caballeronia sp. SBC1]|nr:hypothetical protein SBC2_40190 [Caballeronia sp. SBC2]QIN64738.1 hypothetical protein SBC1_47780 [Caballeronia sp. SBC1]